MQIFSGRGLARLAGSFVVGAVIGLVGTGIHRWMQPWGLIGALVLVLVGGVLGRAWTGSAGVLAVGLGVVTVTGLIGGGGPGGDVIIAAQPIGYLWFAGAIVVAGAAFLPRRWFSEAAALPRDADTDAP
ncbi:hypothetical protein [Actinotalea sp.]|uniref:hypothetical protein n=1 Tax=Actinotalea sp. TaxID=1872145 RepID=UPI00356870D5